MHRSRWKRTKNPFAGRTFAVYSPAAPFCLAFATGEMMAAPAPKPQDSDPFEDRRAYPRVAVAMPAFLQANGERHAVHLLDLSAGGAKGLMMMTTVGAGQADRL